MAETKDKTEKKTGFGRRVFLIGSGVVAGGVAFGVYRVRQPHTNPLLPLLDEGEAAITPDRKSVV